MVNYISSESKTKSGYSKMDKTHNSGHLLRVLWKANHLGPFWMNRSTNNLLATRACNKIYKSNQIPERFLDE